MRPKSERTDNVSFLAISAHYFGQFWRKGFFKMHNHFGRFCQVSIRALIRHPKLLPFSSSPAHSLSAVAFALSLVLPGLATAQDFPITPGQKATAVQVAQTGVAMSELSPNAPTAYMVKRGDTLWAISGLFLKSPWRWPELWGMNLQDIRNPHLIYPGQELFLDTSNGRARLRMGQARMDGPPTNTVRLSPGVRSNALADMSIPTLSAQAIEPFLAEALIVDDTTFAAAPRIVATIEGRVLLSRGDRAYARGSFVGGDVPGKPLSIARGEPSQYRVFRNATPLKDPTTQEILGYEAQYVGQAVLVRGESTIESPTKDGSLQTEIVPATIDIVTAKEEIRVGDRLLPEPPREFVSYVPRAPLTPISGQVVSVFGSAVVNAAENQIVVINRGTRHGMERGHVMEVYKDGARIADVTDASRPQIKLPNERNGYLMVFRTFPGVSYALLIQTTDGVKAGDRFSTPSMP